MSGYCQLGNCIFLFPVTGPCLFCVICRGGLTAASNPSSFQVVLTTLRFIFVVAQGKLKEFPRSGHALTVRKGIVTDS
jgi:hypothetical protein